jgi:hypothetical protein
VGGGEPDRHPAAERLARQVGPVDAQLVQAREDPGGPVVMLNLLRFADGGAATYAEYASALTGTFLPRYGGELLFAGDGSTVLVAEEGRSGTRSC